MLGLQAVLPKEHKLEISAQFERFPIITKYETGEVRYLSYREKALVEVWLKTGGNVGECKRQLSAIGWRGGRVSNKAIEEFMKRKHIIAHVTEKMKEKALAEGYDETKWKAEGIMWKEGLKKEGRMSFFYWKELGKALGFYKEPTSPTMQMNQQINFVQGDGNE